MPNTRAAVRVQCGDTSCQWVGYRVYRPFDDLSPKASGYGRCPKCRQPTLYKAPRAIRHTDR